MQERNRLWLWFGFLFTIVIMIVMLLYFVFQKNTYAGHLVEQTDKLIFIATKLESNLIDVETSQRGYVLTGNEDFLEPYIAVKNSLEQQINELRNLPANNLVQLQRVDRLSLLIEAKMQLANKIIELRRSQRIQESSGLVRSGEGKLIMDKIRAEIGSYIFEEERLLAHRQAELKQSIGLLVTLVAILSAAAIISSFLASVFAYREYRRRLSIEGDARLILERKNSELEIATRKLMEEELLLREQQQHALESRERMIQLEKLTSLGTMVGGVAHEINNPLMGVMNYVEYARDKARDPKSIEVLQNAMQEIERIRKIVQNMLVFLRTDNGKEIACRIQDAVKQVSSLLRGELLKHDIELETIIPENLPLIRFSSGALQQVLVNLILNARDAIEGQEKRSIVITASVVDKTVYLWVCDNGPGIPVEFRDRIFDPFFTTKPVGKGTGLGLSVSRQLVEQVGGSIELDRKEASGCCMKLTFEIA